MSLFKKNKSPRKQGQKPAKQIFLDKESIYQSPLKLILIIGALVYICEAIVMTALSFMPEFPAGVEVLLDSSFLLLLFAPLLYFFLLHPLASYVNASKAAEVRQKEVNKTFERIARERECQDWVKTGQMGLTERVRGEQTMLDLSRNIIAYLASYLKARIGVIYLVNEDNLLKLSGSYAYVKPQDKTVEFQFGESLVGQAAQEQRSFIVSNVPDYYIQGNSEWGESTPHNIVVTPFIYEGTVKGVIELASFQEFTDIQIDFLNLVTEQIANVFNTAYSVLRTKGLLEETQSQTEELQAQQEELKASNEELEERAQALKESEVKLQAQQEELEVSNEEMEERFQAMREKNAA